MNKLTLIQFILKEIIPQKFHPLNVSNHQIIKKSKLQIMNGPFQGLKYVTLGVGSVLSPKLIGVYEKELHPYLEKINQLSADIIINIGAGEGYYVVGLGALNPQAKIVAFEISEDGRQLIKQLWELNGLNIDRLDIREKCEREDLQGCCLLNGKIVIVCDVEGYELMLLDPLRVKNLDTAYILVEIHDFLIPGIGNEIEDRFKQTHTITTITETDRTILDYPDRGLFAQLIPKTYRLAAVKEYRPAKMSWLWMEPNK